jgi:hypothetical protein
MPRHLSASLVGVTPIAFATAETLLVVGAMVAAVGAVITGVIAFRASRRRGSLDDDRGRRAASPSPSSLGMADDPIVAALVGDQDRRTSRPARRSDRTDPS